MDPGLEAALYYDHDDEPFLEPPSANALRLAIARCALRLSGDEPQGE